MGKDNARKPLIRLGGKSISELRELMRRELEENGLRRTLYLTLRYLYRNVPVLNLVSKSRARYVRARGIGRKPNYRRWYRNCKRPVTIVIPTFEDPDLVVECVRNIRATTKRRYVDIIVSDDASPPDVQAELRSQLEKHGVQLLLNEENVGFARNVNRALHHVENNDVILMNNDIIAHKGWLKALQHSAYYSKKTGIAGPKLLYPDGTIQSAGSHRNLGAPEWFDHRYRFKDGDFGPANIRGYCIGVTGACMYIRSEVLDTIGLLDEDFTMAFEDMDYCLRAWEAGFRVAYQPHSVLTHHESKTRGTEQGERELDSLKYFWGKWGKWFSSRRVSAGGEKLKIIYCTHDTGVGGGHRVVFDHMNKLADRGHDVELFTLDNSDDWFDIRVPVRTFKKYKALIECLSQIDAIKVATWWETAEPVWLSSVTKGIPVFFVQDIESSYYRDNAYARSRVLSHYRNEFQYLTTSDWNVRQLEGFGVDVAKVSPGIDLDTFKRDEDMKRSENVILTLGRSNYLKNLDLTLKAWRKLPKPRPELWMFGIEPELGEEDGIRYFESPSDKEVNTLFNQSTVLCQTSLHEGFCLPILEAMATELPVVCTDADGNQDFCVDGENCLMPEADADSVSDALARVLDDGELRSHLAERGTKTAVEYGLEYKIDELERFFLGVAESHQDRVPSRS